MSQVWEHSRQHGSALLVLLAIADFADDDGWAYPSIERLAEKARMSTRNVRYVLRHLEASGELMIVAGGGRHQTNRYRVLVAPPVDGETRQDDSGKVIQGKNFSETQRRETLQNPAETLQNPAETLQGVAAEPLRTVKIRHREPSHMPAAPSAPRSRQRDPLFEAVVEVCYGTDHQAITRTERSRVNRALKELREVGATPEDVYARAAEYRARSPDYPLTPQTLTKLWTDLAIPRGGSRDHHRSRTSNGRAASDSGRARYATEADEIDYRPVYRPRITANPPG
ncbi:MAG: helix-turn-helix domain-containing protein [Frankia sp.]|nr:helix-turn-helix domain-containing protein [Frankia sp.]